ncbi:pentapeptide repeat-containing protein [Streptomyces echinatus]|uniref:pentapeptide repeat-containing protein n=1 Tax=Streptomyces echinatus TaxID=67293 RepID=UPI0037AB4D69
MPGLTAMVALVFTWMSVQQTRTEMRIAEQGQITGRFNDAVGHLGAGSMEMRLGGIYALQRIMQDSSRDQPAIVVVLSAYVRDKAHVPKGGFVKETGDRDEQAEIEPPDDVYAAVYVLNGQPPRGGEQVAVDLGSADLRGLALDGRRDYLRLKLPNGDPSLRDSGSGFRFARLDGADLRRVSFDQVDLRGVTLHGANLSGAFIHRSDLRGAQLWDTDLTKAELTGSLLSGASFTGATLREAKLFESRITEADFTAADLKNAGLNDADLTGAVLYGADLSGADLTGANLREANLTGANLSKARLSGAKLDGVRGLPASMRH